MATLDLTVPAARRALPVAAPAVAAGIAAAAAGLVLLGRRTFTVEEAEAVLAARRPAGEVFTRAIEHDPGRLGHLLALDTTLAWLGESEWAARSLSALAATIAAVFVYLAAARLFGRLGGLAAAGLLVVNAGVVAASQQARPHALALAGIALATWLFLHALDEKGNAAGVAWWIAYAAAAVLLPLAHPVAASVVVAHAAVVAARRHDVRLRLAVPALVFAALESLLFVAAAAVDRHGAEDGAGGLGLRELGGAVLHAAGDNPLLLALAGTGVALLAAGRVPGVPRWTAVLAGGLVVAPALAVLLAAASLPVYPEPALVVAAPGLALAGAGALLAVPRRELAAALAAATALVGAGWVVHWYVSGPAEDWQAAAAAVAAERLPAERVLVVPAEAGPLARYYAPDARPAARAGGAGVWVLVRAGDDEIAVARARAVVPTPAFALLDQRPFGEGLRLQHWVRP